MSQDTRFLNATIPYKVKTVFREDGVKHIGIGEGVMDNLYSGVDGVLGRWIDIRRIGQGGFGAVFLQREAVSGSKRAVKRILRDKTTEEGFSRELISMIKVTDFEHIVRFFAWYESPDFYFIAMEYAKYGDLDQYLKNSETKLALGIAKEIIHQIIKGLVVLHHKDICHRDLKPQNVLITSLKPICVKLGDFGVSKAFEGTELRTMIGTPGYLAPEILGTLPIGLRSRGSNSYTKAVDIWALGCLVHKILTLETPFLSTESLEEDSAMSVSGVHEYSTGQTDIHLIYRFCRGEADILTSSLQRLGLDEKDIRFINRFLAVDPKVRISASDALVDTWFLPYITNPNDIDKSLIQAAENGNLSLVSLLLTIGANYQVVNDNGNSPIYLAAQKGHKDVVQLLLEKGADLNGPNQNGNSPIHVAARNGHKDVVRLLLEKGADLNRAGQSGSTPIHLAVVNAHKDVVQFLLEKGANLNETNQDGNTPIHLAAIIGHKDIAQFLLERGAGLSVANRYGNAPIHFAARHGHKDVVQFLLEKGADLNGVNKSQKAPIHLATQSGHKEIVRYLLQNDADPMGDEKVLKVAE